MTDRELMQMALDALEDADQLLEDEGYSHALQQEAAKALRDRLEQPEPTGRELQKMMQTAWKAVRNQYKDDPECCFALGWEAGYGAVAPRVEPPETESGEGFESLPAPPPKQPEPEPVAWIVNGELKVRLDIAGKLYYSETNVYTAPPKKEWVGLTDEEVGGLTVFDGLTHIEVPILAEFVHTIEAKLKEKNGG